MNKDFLHSFTRIIFFVLLGHICIDLILYSLLKNNIETSYFKPLMEVHFCFMVIFAITLSPFIFFVSQKTAKKKC